MSTENLPPFYVGQKVVRIGGTNEFVKNGSVYTVRDCLKCKCGTWHVVISELAYYGAVGFPCSACFKIIKKNIKFRGGLAKNFAPVQENFQSISLSKVLEEETKLISVN